MCNHCAKKYQIFQETGIKLTKNGNWKQIFEQLLLKTSWKWIFRWTLLEAIKIIVEFEQDWPPNQFWISFFSSLQ